MPRTSSQQNPQNPDDWTYHRLLSFECSAPSRLQRCFNRMDGRDVHVNAPEMREWLFACFQYPEQIQEFLANRGPVPNLTGQFKKAAGWQSISLLINELHETKQECLPSDAPVPNKPTDPFKGVDQLWLPDTVTMPPVIFHARDIKDKTHPIVLSQLTTTIHEPEFSGYCCFVVCSRLPLSGPWDTLTVNTALQWAKDTLKPLPGSEFRLFFHQLPEHGESIQYRGPVYNSLDAGIGNRMPFDQYPGYRPSFIDHTLIDAVNGECRGTRPIDLERTGDPFSLYLQSEFDKARDTLDVDRMQKIDRAHIHHTLRRMRTAVHSYRPPFARERDYTLQ